LQADDFVSTANIRPQFFCPLFQVSLPPELAYDDTIRVGKIYPPQIHWHHAEIQEGYGGATLSETIENFRDALSFPWFEHAGLALALWKGRGVFKTFQDCNLNAH
jgi:hypothetical protein